MQPRRRSMGMSHPALTAVLAGLTIFSIDLPAHATVTVETFPLTEWDSAAVPSFSPSFGTITATYDSGNPNTIHIVETLDPAYKFHETVVPRRGFPNHNALVFNTDIAVTVSGLSTGFAALPYGNSYTAPPFGSGGVGWNNAIECPRSLHLCGPGWAGGYAGPLAFDISAPGLTLADLKIGAEYNGKDIYFVSDLINAAGATGNVGDSLVRAPGPVPGEGLLGLVSVVLAGALARARGFFAR